MAEVAKPLNREELDTIAEELYGQMGGVEFEGGKVYFCVYREEDGSPVEHRFTPEQMAKVRAKLEELGYNPDICGNKLVDQEEL